jgi:nicotinate-nucleotide pyrophosphorylase (carboxylating)
MIGVKVFWMLVPMAQRKIDELLQDDIGFGDLASETLDPDLKIKAVVLAKAEGIVAGTEEASYAFSKLGAKVTIKKQDGEVVRPGDVIMEVEGGAREILAAERTALNLLMWMSGTATATAQMLKKARETNPKIVLACTRKSPLPIFDKKAVEAGGGDPHRFRLDDCVLLKSNHIKLLGGVRAALEKIRKSFTKKVEVEVENAEQALEAAMHGADIVMLDNVPVEEVKRTIELLKQKGIRGKVLVEVSGGINPSNVQEYARAGPDILSSSYMTMHAPALDLSLEIL